MALASDQRGGGKRCSIGSRARRSDKRKMVPGTGLEPVRPCGRGILSMCLQVSPQHGLSLYPQLSCWGSGRSGWSLRGLNLSSSLCTFRNCSSDLAHDRRGKRCSLS